MFYLGEMVSQIFDESPKEIQLISSDDESHAIKQVNSIEKVQMRALGLVCESPSAFIFPGSYMFQSFYFTSSISDTKDDFNIYFNWMIFIWDSVADYLTRIVGPLS